MNVPENTPSEDTVYVMVLPFVNGSWDEEDHVPLKPMGEGLWSGNVAVEEGALVRYVYDRWNESEWKDFKEMREASGESIRIESRWLLVGPTLDEVTDVVETWNDLRAPASTGTITGTIVDAATGAPIMDANVSVGGIHTASDYDGRFEVRDIAAGNQRVTVFRNLGEHVPTTATVEVPDGDVVNLAIGMEAAQRVQVAFNVVLPEDTPEDAEIRLVGNVFQTGARPGVSPNMPIMGSNLNLPTLERSAANRARGTILLHEGTYLQYFYSIGSSSRGQEYNDQGRLVYRTFVAGLSSQMRRDRVATWRPSEHSVSVTLRVEVPPNTAPGAIVTFNAGPSHWMTQTGPHEWAMFLYGFPGQIDQYRYLIGDDHLGADGTEGLDDSGFRTLVFPETDAVVQQRVERWKWSPVAAAARSGEPTDVAFRVSVPPSTAHDATVRLVGDDPALESGVVMNRQPGNPWLYEAVVPLPGESSVRYWYHRGGDTRSQRDYELVVRHTNQIANDWVTVWSDSPTGSSGTIPEFITGVYTPDLWSEGFLDLSPGTFDRIKAHNGGWVVVSSVWHFGQFDPPIVEPRRVKAPSVLIPREDIVAQAGIARDKGLQVILGPQFNMEMVPGGGDAVCRSHSRQWLDAWLVEAERLWMWNAITAEEIGAAAMVLPGYCFHVFAPVDGTQEESEEFDGQVAALIAKVRSIFSGKLIMSGGVRDFDFPSQADLVGVTTYDTGHPDLKHDATVDEWKAAYDALFTERVDPIHERWGKPVFFYTIHLPPVPGDPSPTGEAAQARRLEGIFQALEERTWIAGTLSWAYPMVDAPLDPSSYGLRGRLAEAVLAKYYGLYSGRQ